MTGNEKYRIIAPGKRSPKARHNEGPGTLTKQAPLGR